MALKVTHDQFKSYNISSSAKKVMPPGKKEFDDSFEEAKKFNHDVEKHLKKAMDDLNPLRVLKLFRRITAPDCELLGLNPLEVRPEMFLWLYVPAPPVCIRPSVGQEAASTEDDITAKLGDIVKANTELKDVLRKGSPVQSIMEHWDFLSLQIAMYINSDVPGLQKADFGKQIRGFAQRLKGKQGRFRGNLSGKRVDFSSRTVISPDPNLSIDEVAVPELVAKNLTYPETVSRYNKAKLQACVRNGTRKWPGANYVSKGGFRLFLRYGNPNKVAEDLQEGDIVERHLDDGDIVLFNRQPSLHRLSILCHYVRVRPHRTFRLNECVCNPYNADFDGDEMNLHVPQTEEARTEAVELMGVKHNLVTPKNGEPIIAAIQDFVSAAFLISSKDKFYDRKAFTNICLYMLEAETRFQLPAPAILKPQNLWTGKQIFNVLMCPNAGSQILVNLDAKCRAFQGDPRHPDLDPNDGWLCIRNSEVMCGVMDKSTIGAGKKDSLFYVLLREFGPDSTAQAMNRLSRLSARWLTDQGFSIGINDVTPGDKISQINRNLIQNAFKRCDDFTAQLTKGTLTRVPGTDLEGSLEVVVLETLNKVRSAAANTCNAELSRWNTPLMMARSGAKGSDANVAQMVALLGQQDIEGKRVQDGFQDRTLPHFAKHSRTPQSKGFIRNSFFTGLNPSEFLFHAVSGRVGLVDTAVKTAETGYMSRRLMKSLEDLSTKYDHTVRNSSSNIVQFKYGDDELDPVDMEATARPVNFDRTFTQAEATTWNSGDKSLLPDEMMEITDELLARQRAQFVRKNLMDQVLPYTMLEEGAIKGQHSNIEDADQDESIRNFLQSIHDYILARAKGLSEARTKRNTQAATERPKKRIKTRSNMHDEKDRLELTSKISEPTLRKFIQSCLDKYKKAQVEPGHAVGAVGAQSIGEPGTQMTLKTFHFAGVAGMSLTSGVPRIKEIINASKVISTPVITCELENKNSVDAARIVKGRIESTYLSDVVEAIDDNWPTGQSGYISIKISLETINRLALDLKVEDVYRALKKNKRVKSPALKIVIAGKTHLRISISDEVADSKKAATAAAKLENSNTADPYLRLKLLKRLLPGIHVLGHAQATRAIVQEEADPDAAKAKKEATLPESKPSGDTSSRPKSARTPKANAEEVKLKTEEDGEPKVADVLPALAPEPVKRHKLLVEGYGLQYCLGTDGIAARSTRTNSIMETASVLGIEAARSTIITELQAVTKDLGIDPRHMALLADVMTYKGEVLGITRFGLAKMRDSVLQLASFEKTADHLFEAGGMGKIDGVEGVSECIIMGKTAAIGTGSVDVFRPMGFKEADTAKRATPFEDAWNDINGRKGRR